MRTILSEIRSEASLNEHQRLQFRLEYAKMVSTAVALFVPLMVLAGTVLGNYVLALARERVDFELKATEIVMNASSPAAARTKAAILAELFPDRLPPKFVSTLEQLYETRLSEEEVKAKK